VETAFVALLILVTLLLAGFAVYGAYRLARGGR
jgi:hypothetical protein